jgi:O-antigen/teichoic acid export membrane protein
LTAALLGTLLAEATVLIIGIASGALTARLLLPEGRGALAAVVFWPQLLAGVGLLSLNQAVTYRIGIAPDRTRTVSATGLWLSLILATVTAVTGYNVIPHLLGGERAHLAQISAVYLLAFVPFNFVTLVLIGEDQGRLDFRRFNGSRLVVPSVYLVALLGLWAFDAVSVFNVAAANCLATILGGLFRIKLDWLAFSTPPSIKESELLLQWALWAHPATLLGFLSAQADRFVVLLIWGDIAVGHYMVALTVATSALAVVTGAFQKVLFPKLAHTADRHSQATVFIRGMCYSSVLLLALAFPVMLALPWLIPMLFGGEFRDAVIPAVMLVGAYLLIAMRTITTQSLLAFGLARVSLTGEAIALVSFLGVMLLLQGRLGLAGVGLALWLANIVALAYLGNRLWKCYGVGMRTLYVGFYELATEMSGYALMSKRAGARSRS